MRREQRRARRLRQRGIPGKNARSRLARIKQPGLSIEDAVLVLSWRCAIRVSRLRRHVGQHGDGDARGTHSTRQSIGIYVMDDTNPNGKYRQWSLGSLTDDVWAAP